VLTGDSPPAEPKRLSVSPGWLALVLSILGGFWQIAVTSANVSENARRIAVLEADGRVRGDSLSRIDARTARIEAQIEVLMNGRSAFRPLSEPPTPGEAGR
jgi:hypothetical protein